MALFVGALLHRKNRFPFDVRVLNAIRVIALAFFLAVVGLQAGGGIVAVFQDVGMILILVGVVGAVVPALVAFGMGRFIFKMNWLLLSGSICGAMTSTPGLGIAIEGVGSDEPAIGYGAVYPVALIVVVICTMVLHAIL